MTDHQRVLTRLELLAGARATRRRARKRGVRLAATERDVLACFEPRQLLGKAPAISLAGEPFPGADVELAKGLRARSNGARGARAVSLRAREIGRDDAVEACVRRGAGQRAGPGARPSSESGESPCPCQRCAWLATLSP